MMKRTHILSGFFLVLLFSLTACQPAGSSPTPRIETPALPSEELLGTPGSPEVGTTFAEDVTPAPKLTSIEEGSPFCEVNPEDLLIPECENGKLSIIRSDDPRRVDIFMARDVVLEADTVSIKAEVVSTPPDGQPLDQNQYGLFIIDSSGMYHAVRYSGQYFNLETWSISGENPKIESRYNKVFSPLLKPAGQSNYFDFECTQSLCEIKINGELAGRVPQGIDGVTRAGIFSADDWDQNFGRVVFDGFDVNSLGSNPSETQPFILKDDLTADRGTFSDRGLAGAFSAYKTDGFHFSPVVPFNFYTARTGPSLANVSVEATVTMEIQPGVSGSQFAGVVCRASQEGSYMAVIKVDGTYTIFRDTPQRPLAVLAHKASDAILPGVSANQIRLDCYGDQINLTINGRQVESLADTRYDMNFGRTGLYTKAGGDPNENAIIFSDLTITELR